MCVCVCVCVCPCISDCECVFCALDAVLAHSFLSFAQFSVLAALAHSLIAHKVKLASFVFLCCFSCVFRVVVALVFWRFWRTHF